MGQERQPLAETPFRADEARMVGGIADRGIDPPDVRELGEWSTCPQTARRRHKLRRYLIKTQIGAIQMMADIAHVSDFNEQIRTELTLDIEVVLVGNRGALLRIEEGNRGVGRLRQA